MTTPKEAIEELLEVADLRGDSTLLHPADDPGLWTARMQSAWDDIRAAIPIAELHEQAVKELPTMINMLKTAIDLCEQEWPDCETHNEKIQLAKVIAILEQLEVLK